MSDTTDRAALGDPGFLAAIRDPARLEELQRVARLMLTDPPRTEGFSRAQRDGEHVLALLIKRTYSLADGRCEYAGEEGQEVLMRGEVPHDREVEPPRCSPPLYMNDYVAVKRATDVVVQGLAFAHEPGTRKAEVSLRVEGLERRIAVFGPRHGEYDRHGVPRFSEPEPFGAVPLRYDHAFGGVDIQRMLEPFEGLPGDTDVELPAFSDLHYPRNPCGKGYLIELTRKHFEGLVLPSLEDPNDPLRPERLAVGKPERWLHAPLPVCWDWQASTWFPRVGYLGLTPEVEDAGVVPAEAKRGWAARDILSIPAVHENPDSPVRLEHYQGASPGLAVDRLPLDAGFEIHGMHPKKKRLAFRLPGEVPEVELELSPGVLSPLEPHLDTVIVRPYPGELVMVWSMRARGARRYEDDEVIAMRRKVGLRRVGKGGAR